MVTAAQGTEDDLASALAERFRQALPNFMQPQAIVVRDALPHNQNGKIDRRALAEEYRDRFLEATP